MSARTAVDLDTALGGFHIGDWVFFEHIGNLEAGLIEEWKFFPGDADIPGEYRAKVKCYVGPGQIMMAYYRISALTHAPPIKLEIDFEEFLQVASKV
jgi:hypothetical protein